MLKLIPILMPMLMLLPLLLLRLPPFCICCHLLLQLLLLLLTSMLLCCCCCPRRRRRRYRINASIQLRDDDSAVAGSDAEIDSEDTAGPAWRMVGIRILAAPSPAST